MDTKKFTPTAAVLETLAKIRGKNINESVESVDEKLCGGQKKLDKNHNGKLDTDDFKKLRKEDVELEEGRGKKGKAKQAAKFDDNDSDDWGKDGKKKFKIKRGASMNKKAVWDESVEQVDEAKFVVYHTGSKEICSMHNTNKSAETAAQKKGKDYKVASHAYWQDNIKESVEYDYLVLDEEFGIGEIIEFDADTATIVFENNIVDMPTDEIFVEEVEQLDELSKETMQSYQKKAKDAIDGSVKRGKPSKATVAMRAKRGAGLEAVKAKLTAIHQKEYAAHRAHTKKLGEGLDNHFAKEAPKVLAKHGYEKIHDHADITTYAKKHDSGHVSTISIKRKPDAFGGSKHEVRATNTHGTSWSTHRPFNSIWDDKDHQKHAENMMPRFENHVIDVKDSTDDRAGWH